jgi:uridine kinase
MEHKHSGLNHIWCEIEPILLSCKKIIKDLSRTPVFWIPLFLKLISAYFLASYATTELFIPFIKYFVFSGGDNPYVHFYNSGITHAFPYPALMLWMLSIPYAIVSIFSQLSVSVITHADILLLRLPLLVADIGILLVLVSWFKKWQTEVLWLYWCSPILFYITYINGQLDVLPIALLFCFLYFLFKEYDYTAFLFLGFAISAKVGMIIVFPFVCLYMIKERRNIWNSIAKLCIPLVTFLILNYSYLTLTPFTEMVFKTKGELKVFDLILVYNQNLFIYIIPLVYAIILFKFSTFKRYNRDLFMVFLGFSFFILTLCIAPLQGWYYWIIPFAVYFYTKAHEKERILYYAITLAYFLYFALIPTSDFFSVLAPTSSVLANIPNLYNIGIKLGLPVSFFVNASFTLLQVILLLNVYYIYRKGIEQYTRYKMHYKPFLIGIAGDSGSGKTTFSELLRAVFAPRHVSIIAGDDMHKWERGNDMWMKYTHLDPRANELHTDIQNVYTMKDGSSIMRRQYDHASGKFMLPQKHESKRLVIFEGLHTLFLEKVRKAFDVRIFISTEEQLRRHWMIIRDSEKRGYTEEQIIQRIESRFNDAENYIKVQEKYSDIVVSFKNATPLDGHLGKKFAPLSIMLEITCANDIGLQPLLDELSKYINIDYLIRDEKQTIQFAGNISSHIVDEIAKTIIPELDELSIEDRVWHNGYNGVLQLFITFYIFEAMRLEHL